MEIALMADDKKKELMIQFCIAYAGTLNKHNLCATGATARQISEATGLTIEPYLGGIQGGGEQVLARISCDEIDLVIYFRDPQAADESLDFSRVCDVHNIPYATNLAGAEVLILALQRGDLDWRYNLKPRRSR
ncbi:MAG: methylglyoxal synthase [Clostridia bacterium]|nr:methylglyoxal synthase [Clostridia bacterium]MBQ9557324.1 methylglyoxal synthase [Clostridia bacterium]